MIKAPFYFETPRRYKGFGNVAHVKLWYLYARRGDRPSGYSQFICSDILFWHSNLYSNRPGRAFTPNGKPCGWLGR